MAKNTFIWGNCTGNLKNKGRSTFVAVIVSLAAVLILITIVRPDIVGAYPASAPGEVVGKYNGLLVWLCLFLSVGAYLAGEIYSTHFRLDGATANADGLTIYYSEILSTLGDYTNKSCHQRWSEVQAIQVEPSGDESENFKVIIYFKHEFANGEIALHLVYPDKPDAVRCKDELLTISALNGSGKVSPSL
jgi:hypothetical protein